jgi:hypothetical protein
MEVTMRSTENAPGSTTNSDAQLGPDQAVEEKAEAAAEAAKAMIARLQALSDQESSRNLADNINLMLEVYRVMGDLVAVNGHVYAEPLIHELHEAITRASRPAGGPMLIAKTASADLPKDLLIRILLNGVERFLSSEFRAGEFEIVRFPHVGNLVEAVYDNRAQLVREDGSVWLDAPIDFGSAEALAIALGLNEDELRAAAGGSISVRARMVDASPAMQAAARLNQGSSFYGFE